ncbi:MAG: cysteine desulfurase family protein [Eubacteriales bacterium]|nr:cysteine desulfurase family protein [Eubacteriales bacterium]
MALIYLDHSATTWPAEETIADYARDLGLYAANPASLHRLGQQAARLIRDSKTSLAHSLSCQPSEVILTSGGSESINMALKGTVAANPKRGRTIVTLAGEHAATRETVACLEKQGFIIRKVALRTDGQVDLDQLAAAIDDDTVLITVLLVNNETGVIQPLDQIVAIRNRKRPRAAIHVDGVQACGKIPVRFDQLGVELFSGSGHKFGAPKGVGFLLVKKGLSIQPLIHGGGQQSGLRGGTENAPLAASLARSLARSVSDLTRSSIHCQNLQDILLQELRRLGVAFARISPETAVPQILNLAFLGLRGETLQHALEQEDLFVSTGSACSSHKKGPSEVLLAMGVSRAVADCSIRISLSECNTTEEMVLAAGAIARACQKYRR